MALQLSYDDSYGSTHASAYHRITFVEMFVAERVARVKIATYVNQTARNDGRSPLGEMAYSFSGTDYDDLFDDTNMSPVDKNPIKNAYENIKGRPEWAGATDV
jgi:hypothetical protein